MTFFHQLSPSVVAAVVMDDVPEGFLVDARWDLSSDSLLVTMWIRVPDENIVTHWRLTSDELDRDDIAQLITERTREGVDAILALTVPKV